MKGIILWGVAEVEEGLNGADACGPGSPVLAHGDVPRVAEGIGDRALPIAPRHVSQRLSGRRTGAQSAIECGVGIGNIEMDEHGTSGILIIGVAKFDDGIADAYFGVHEWNRREVERGAVRHLERQKQGTR
jgi:hypothetical protein